MKFNYIWVLLCLLVQQQTQAQCEPKGITTNPHAPVNAEIPPYRNTFFDWTKDRYDAKFSTYSQSSVYSPFTNNNYQNENIDALIQSKDYLPEDGWELIDWNMGYEEDLSESLSKSHYLHFALYNRYRSIMRVFVAGKDPSQRYNSVSIEMKVEGEQGQLLKTAHPTLLNLPAYAAALDNYAWQNKNQKLATTRVFQNGFLDNWVYADFYVAYDPCVCLYKSKILFRVMHIDESEIKLTGLFEGIISQVDNTTQQDRTPLREILFTIDREALGEIGSVAYKGYSNYIDFVNDQEKQLKIFDKEDHELTDKEFEKRYEINSMLYDVYSGVASNNFLRSTLQAVPYIGGALELVSFFSGKGNAKEPSAPPPPHAVNAKMELNGYLKGIYNAGTYAVKVPGSVGSDVQDKRYPYYNEKLGVVNLLNTPVVRYKRHFKKVRSGTNKGFRHTSLGGKVYYLAYVENEDIYREQLFYELDPFDYVINPASGFDMANVDVMAQIVFKNGETLQKRPYSYEYGCSPYLPTLNPNLKGSKLFHIPCLTSTSFVHDEEVIRKQVDFFGRGEGKLKSVTFPENMQASKDPEVYVKMFFNLKRKDNGERVLHVLTYKAKLETDNSLPTRNMQSTLVPQYLLLEDTVLSSTPIEASTIEVGKNVSTLNNMKVDVIAHTQIKNRGNASLIPNLNLSLFPVNSGSCYTQPTPKPAQVELQSFCRSNEYLNERVAKKKQDKKREETTNCTQPSVIQVDVYPNPANQVLHVKISTTQEGTHQIKLLNQLGQSVYNQSVTLSQGETLHSIPVDHLQRGIYIFNMVGESMPSISKKILLQ